MKILFIHKGYIIVKILLSNICNVSTQTFLAKRTAKDTAWAELLLGPRGILTAVFHVLDDRRKITEKIKDRIAISKNGNDNSETTGTYHQSDLSLLPDFLVDGQLSIVEF